MKSFYLMILILCAGSGPGWAGKAQPGITAETAGESATQIQSIEDFDIDAVVEATVKAMADAARNYYLPDKPANSKAIARYAKDARELVFRDSDFKKELGRICIDLANAAVRSSGQDVAMLPGQPLTLRQTYPDYNEGVSSITVTQGRVMVEYINTMPCINAAAKALHGGVRRQYLPESPENSPAKDAYGNEFAAIMSGNRLFNHTLSEVCAELVGLASHMQGRYSRKNIGTKSGSK